MVIIDTNWHNYIRTVAKMVTASSLFVVVGCLFSTTKSIQMMFERFEKGVDSNLMQTDLRVKKINRTMFAASGTVTVLTDLDNNYEAYMDFYHSPMGNRQFNMYPMKISKQPICELLQGYYKDNFLNINQSSVENLPDPSDCPLTKRVITFTDYMLNGDLLSVYHPAGLWKTVLSVGRINDDTSTASLVALFKIYPNGYL